MNTKSQITLQQQAFNMTPDPRYLFLTEAHRRAQVALIDTVDRRQGFTVLTAAPGMGKTTLLFDFLETVGPRARTIFLFFTQCSATDLLRYIARDLGLDPSDDITKLHKDLVDVMTIEARSGRTVVLIIDEAQHLSTDGLEAIRLLTNFETTLAKLLQVVLVGQPLLLQKLSIPALAQVRQRIVHFNQLVPLSIEESHAYIRHRIHVAGSALPSSFSADALNDIVLAAGGIPRVINNICSLALQNEHRNDRPVDTTIVSQAISELQLHNPAGRYLRGSQVNSTEPQASREDIWPELRSYPLQQDKNWSAACNDEAPLSPVLGHSQKETWGSLPSTHVAPQPTRLSVASAIATGIAAGILANSGTTDARPSTGKEDIRPIQQTSTERSSIASAAIIQLDRRTAHPDNASLSSTMICEEQFQMRYAR